MSHIESYRKLAAQQDLPLFFQPQWLDRVSKNWDVVIAKNNGIIVAVWPFVKEKKAGISIIRNPLLTPYLGPYFIEPADNKNEMLETLWSQLPAWDFFDVQCFPGLDLEVFFSGKGFECTNRVTHILSLELSEEALWKQIEPKRRARIRKAMADLELGDGMLQLDDFYTIHKHTLTSKKVKYPYTVPFFKKIINQSVDAKSGTVFSVANTSITAMAFTVHDEKTAYLLLSSMNPENTHPGGVSLLIWEAIKEAKREGLQYFDFEGSVDPGIAGFFKSFGGKKINYWSCTCNNSLIWKWKKKILG